MTGASLPDPPQRHPLLQLALLALLLAAPLVAAAGLAADAVLLRRALHSLAWIAGLALLVRLVNFVLWERVVEQGMGLRMPRLLRQVVGLVLVVLGVAALLNQVWEVAIATVLATTGVLGLVLGLALRPILTDLFSGIALNIEQPFRLGDFVMLRPRGQRDPIVGVVREINWRSTRVLTPEDNLISVPNSVVAAAIVENLSFPSPVSEQEVDITLAWEAPTPSVEAVLQAAVAEAWAQGATAGERPPTVRLCRLDGAGCTYRIVYLLDPRRKAKGPARHLLLGCVRQHLRCAGLQPAAPAEATLPPPPLQPPDHARTEHRLRLLGEVWLMSVLDEGERAALAAGLHVRAVGAGQVVVGEGEPGGSMFVVAAGALEVRQGGQRIGALGPGGFFGEMSMLTGEPRSAAVAALVPAVVYEVPHEAIAPLLARRPALAEALSQVVELHRRDDAQRARSAAAPAAGGADSLADRIRRFFRQVVR